MRRIGELNDAYAAIARGAAEEREREPDMAVRGAKNGKRGGLLTRRRAPVRVDRDRTLYEILHVAPHAEAEIIRIAAGVLLQKQARTQDELDRQAAIERAREVLSDPGKRAAYDKSQGIERVEASFMPAPRPPAQPSPTTPEAGAPASEAAAEPAPGQLDGASAAVERGRRTQAPAPEQATSTSHAPAQSLQPSAVDPTREDDSTAQEPLPSDEEPDSEPARDGRTADMAPSAADADVAPPVAPPPTVDAQHDGARVEPEETDAAGDEPRRADDASGEAVAADEERDGAFEAAPPRRWWPAALFRHDDNGDIRPDVEEAETERVRALMQQTMASSTARLNGDAAHGDQPLADEEELPAPRAEVDESPGPEEDGRDETPTAPPSDDAEASHEIEPDAVLRFMSGPRKGARIAITRDAIILGSTPSADVMLPIKQGPGGTPRIRIWKQADSYLLQQVEGPLVLIGGRPIDMPIVVLDDGDQIEIGDNTLRFERIAVSERRVIPFQSAG